MEEVYVIKVKGNLPGTTEETSSDTSEEATLGLGVLHVLFGSVAVIMGTLGLVIGSDFGLEIFFGLVFACTGVSSFAVWKFPYRKRLRKLLFFLSAGSVASSVILLILTIVAVAHHHIVYGGPGVAASIRANIVINCILEMIVACFSTFTTANTIWNCNILQSLRNVSPISQKVIVTTNISIGDPNVNPEEGMVRHVSPYCVISFQKSDEKREIARRLQDFVRDAQNRTYDGDLSVADSEDSVEEEVCIDSQSCSNDVLNVNSQLLSEPSADDNST